MGQSLDQLGVPQEFRDRAKIMWIIVLLANIWGWIICAFIWKLPGQEQNQWFQFQLKQAMWAGIISVVTWWIGGIGGIVQFIYGLLGFLAINKGEDYEAPAIANMSRG